MHCGKLGSGQLLISSQIRRSCRPEANRMQFFCVRGQLIIITEQKIVSRYSDKHHATHQRAITPTQQQQLHSANLTPDPPTENKLNLSQALVLNGRAGVN